VSISIGLFNDRHVARGIEGFNRISLALLDHFFPFIFGWGKKGSGEHPIPFLF